MRGGIPRILLEGRPGVGKTTVVRRVADLLREEGIKVCGFFTEELREAGRRVGFAIETLEGQRAVLAHVDLSGPPRVGRYGVDLPTFERLALPALAASSADQVLVIDELGKMELASAPFRAAVAEVFARPVAVVATVHVFGHPFTDALKERGDVEIVRVTERDRHELPRRVAARIVGRGAAGGQLSR